MEDHVDWEKIARWLAGECTERERLEMEAWLEADPLRRDYVESLKSIWKFSEGNLAEWDVDVAWKKFSRRLHELPPRKDIRFVVQDQRGRFASFAQRLTSHRYGQSLRVAVMLVFFGLGLTYVLIQLTETEPQVYAMREVVTEKGHRAEVRLADGTKVVLNAASSIRFPEQFTAEARELTLEGEAYFEVMPADGIPFIVHTREATIEVLGTEFNIEAWPDDERLQVVVSGGKVAFRSNRSANPQEIFLTRGQMAHLSGDGVISQPLSVDIKTQLAWLDGRLVFDNLRFGEVLKQLERRFNVTFAVSDSVLLRRHLTASFERESIDDLLKVIGATLKVNYKRSNGVITFLPPRINLRHVAQ